ncbi:MAG: PRC-barrel domain-containing protein [Gemmatimonadota bacterium]|nr:PRC-barrel domain-containing protein [Gemmatimonadota bacterium]
MADRMERDMARATGGTLARLDELDDYEVADGEPDIRGWKVKTADGTEVGTVDGLIVDPDARSVRYMEVSVKRELLGTTDDEHVLVPIASARLNDDDDTVLIQRLPVAGLRGAPRFGKRSLGADDDRALVIYYALEPHGETDDSRMFFGNRRPGRESADYFSSRSSTEPRAGS